MKNVKSRLLFISSMPLYIIFAKASFKIYQFLLSKAGQHSFSNSDSHRMFSFFCIAIWLILLYSFGVFVEILEINKSIKRIEEKTQIGEQSLVLN